jgi:hypothetical protein
MTGEQIQNACRLFSNKLREMRKLAKEIRHRRAVDRIHLSLIESADRELVELIDRYMEKLDEVH